MRAWRGARAQPAPGDPCSGSVSGRRRRRQRGVRALWRIARASPSSASARASQRGDRRAPAPEPTPPATSRPFEPADLGHGRGVEQIAQLQRERRRRRPGERRGRRAPGAASRSSEVAPLPVVLVTGRRRYLPPAGRPCGRRGGRARLRCGVGAVGRGDARHPPLRSLRAARTGRAPARPPAGADACRLLDLADAAIERLRLRRTRRDRSARMSALASQIAGAVGRRGDRQRARLRRPARAARGAPRCRSAPGQRLGVGQPRAQAVVVADAARSPA